MRSHQSCWHHPRPSPMACTNILLRSQTKVACDVSVWYASHNARQDGRAFQTAGCVLHIRVCIASPNVTYLMGAEALLAKHASQSSVLNQGCVLMSATPPLRFPILLLKSACTCAEPTELMLSCWHDDKRHHTKLSALHRTKAMSFTKIDIIIVDNAIFL